jgi:ABC-type nitrate/sulfonate/bicarbonate transport system ATPase subunit
MWKKSIFWELPYWEILEVRNTIDVMHVMKNFCLNLLGHQGVYVKSKDTTKSRRDLKLMKQQDDLHPEREVKEIITWPLLVTLKERKRRRRCLIA